MKTVKLTHVSPWSLLKIGFLIGWIAAFPFIALLSFLFFKLVAGLVNWLGGLVYEVRLPLLGNFGFDIDVIELLNLQGFYEHLQGWTVVGIIPTLLLILLVTTAVGLFWGLVAALSGWVFNLLSRATGGVEVTLAEPDKS